MSNAGIIRKSFNGGEIAPELHYRSDLEAYHNSCKTLKNMQVTPWGAATRRPPTKLLSQIDTAAYGVPVKYIPFRFSLTEVFHIVFTDGSGSASPNSATADMIVFDSTGTMVTLEGAGTMILDTVYDPDDLVDLHFIQVNDFIYMTCGGEYPVQSINRYYNDTDSGNRWRIEKYQLNNGPYMEPNTDPYNSLSVFVEGWESTISYSRGDVVFSSNTCSGISGSTGYAGRPGSNYYTHWHPVFTTSSNHGLQVGDTVRLKGISYTQGSFYVSYDTYTYIVTKVPSSTTFETSLYVGSGAYPSGSLGIESDAEICNASAEPGFYVSLQDNNTNRALENQLWWSNLKAWTGEVNISSSSELFEQTDVGRSIRINNETTNGLSDEWTEDNISDEIPGLGTVTLTTEGGAWAGLLNLEVSTNGGGVWRTLGSIRSGAGLRNGSIEREITDISALIRVKLTEYDQQSGYDLNACAWKLEFKGDTSSHFIVTEYTNSAQVKALALSPITGTFSHENWALGEFSDTTGYPRTLAIHDERLILGGSKSKPNTVWASRINDWTNFLETDLDTSPYTFTLASDSYDSIRWMRSARQLMIGTDNGENTMGTRDSSEAITQTNLDVQRQTNFGSNNVQAVVTADLVFFVQGQGRRVRSTQYDFGTDQYLSSEMSILAHHITESGIKEMSFRRHPYSTIFFLLENGKAVSFTYDRENRVKGWSQVEVGGSGEIVSAASNYSDSGDIVAAVVKRGSAYSLESFGSIETDTIYLDSQVQFIDQDYSAGVSVPWSSADGLTVVHNDAELEGTDYTISGGTLTIPGYTDGQVTVGYKYYWEIEPTDIVELGDFGSVKRVSKLSLYLLESGGCKVNVNGRESPFKECGNLCPGDRLDGEYELTTGGGYDTSISIKLSGDDHKPFNLSAIGLYATKR